MTFENHLSTHGASRFHRVKKENAGCTKVSIYFIYVINFLNDIYISFPSQQ